MDPNFLSATIKMLERRYRRIKNDLSSSQAERTLHLIHKYTEAYVSQTGELPGW